MAHRRGSFRRSGISQAQRRKKTWISVKQSSGLATSGEANFRTSIQMNLPATGASQDATTKVSLALVSDFPGTTPGTQGLEESTLPEESTILRVRGSLLFPKNEIQVS